MGVANTAGLPGSGLTPNRQDLRTPDAPTRLHTWGVVTGGENGDIVHNPVGVCRERADAVKRVDDELRRASPGSIGVVCVVPVSEPIELDYAERRLVAYAHIDPDTGTLVWRRGDV